MAWIVLLCLMAASLAACDEKPQLTATPMLTNTPNLLPTDTPITMSTPTPTPTTTLLQTPIPTTTPVPTSTLMTTPVPTPTPTTTPVPATYHIEGLDVEFTDGGKGLVHAEFSVVVSNLGDLEGVSSVPVEVMVDGEDPEVVHIIEDLAGGDAASFAFSRELAPGDHGVVVRVADADVLLDVTARAADITIETLGYSITGNGFIELQVEVNNHGNLAAESVIISADWSLNPDNSADSNRDISAGRDESAAVITGLGPGEEMVISLPFRVETGSYTFGFNADTETIEAHTDNNAAETLVEVDYVQLVVTVDSVRHLGYERTGEGLVEIDVLVANEGVAASSQLSVGVKCDEEHEGGCSQTLILDPVPAGGSSVGAIPVTLPQGKIEVLVFAGAPDEGYLWGDSNVRQHTIDVPLLSAVRLVLDAETTVNGYWSDGTANVEVTASLHNEGYREFEDIQQITFICVQDGETIDNCNGEFNLSLLDGFGPTVADSLTLRMPTGTVSFHMDYGGDELAVVERDISERILGVYREVWECFSDRPGIQADDEGCGGWYPDTIVKWDQDTPIKIWATGHKDYVEVLAEVLDELSPLLNLKFEWVESKEQAYLDAHMGITISEAVNADVYCVHSLGCADWQHHMGVVTDATIGVWIYESDWFSDVGLLDEVIKSTTIHEVLHALVPMTHRTHPASVMSINRLRLPALSPMDEALIRLNSHPLVKPGMTMPEVRDLIVFSDEVLDPPQPEEPSGYEMVRRAYVALQEAGSARFRISGSWRGSRCDKSFGWADYEIADFKASSARLVHFNDGTEHFYLIYASDDAGSDEYWSKSGGRWQQVDSDEVFDNTNWRRGFSSPLSMLASILFFADVGDIAASRTSDGGVRLMVDLENAYVSLPWSRSETLSAVLVLDEKTYEIREYRMTWRFKPFGRSCPRYEMEATNGEYGIDIEFPNAIAGGSENLSSITTEPDRSS